MRLREFLNNLTKEQAQQLKIAIVGPVASWNPVFTSATNNAKFSGDFSKFVNIHISNDAQDGLSLIELINNASESGVSLPDNLRAYTDVQEAAKDADILLMATPVDEIVNVCEQLAGEIKPNAFALCLTQEMRRNDYGYVELVSETINDILGIPCYTLAGYEERNLNSNTDYQQATLGCQNPVHAAILGKLINHNDIKLNVTSDVEAVELCGALKNLIELGAGICNGLHLNENAKTRIMLEGLNEMIMFFKTFHAERNLVDVFAKCGIPEIFSMEHVNKNMLMAQCFVVSNKPIDQIERELLKGHRLNGVSTADGVYHMLKFHNVDKKFPLFTTIHRVCSNIMKAKDIVDVCSVELDDELEMARCNDDIFKIITNKVLKQQHNVKGAAATQQQRKLRGEQAADAAAAAASTSNGVHSNIPAVNAMSIRKFSTLPPRETVDKNTLNLDNEENLLADQHSHEPADEAELFSSESYYSTGITYNDQVLRDQVIKIEQKHPQAEVVPPTHSLRMLTYWGFVDVPGIHRKKTICKTAQQLTDNKMGIIQSSTSDNSHRAISTSNNLLSSTYTEDEWLKSNKKIMENAFEFRSRKYMSPLPSTIRTLKNSKIDLSKNEIKAGGTDSSKSNADPNENPRKTHKPEVEEPEESFKPKFYKEITMKPFAGTMHVTKVTFLPKDQQQTMDNISTLELTAKDSTPHDPYHSNTTNTNTTNDDNMKPVITESSKPTSGKKNRRRLPGLSQKEIQEITLRRKLERKRAKKLAAAKKSDSGKSSKQGQVMPKYRQEVWFEYKGDANGNFSAENEPSSVKPRAEYNTKEFQTITMSSDDKKKNLPQKKLDKNLQTSKAPSEIDSSYVDFETHQEKYWRKIVEFDTNDNKATSKTGQIDQKDIEKNKFKKPGELSEEKKEKIEQIRAEIRKKNAELKQIEKELKKDLPRAESMESGMQNETQQTNNRHSKLSEWIPRQGSRPKPIQTTAKHKDIDGIETFGEKKPSQPKFESDEFQVQNRNDELLKRIKAKQNEIRQMEREIELQPIEIDVEAQELKSNKPKFEKTRSEKKATPRSAKKQRKADTDSMEPATETTAKETKQKKSQKHGNENETEPKVYEMRQRSYEEIPKMPERKLRTFEMTQKDKLRSEQQKYVVLPKSTPAEPTETAFEHTEQRIEDTKSKSEYKRLKPAKRQIKQRAKKLHSADVEPEIEIESKNPTKLRETEIKLDKLKMDLKQAKRQMEQLIIEMMESENEGRKSKQELSEVKHRQGAKEEINPSKIEATELENELKRKEKKLKQLQFEIAQSKEMKKRASRRKGPKTEFTEITNEPQHLTTKDVRQNVELSDQPHEMPQQRTRTRRNEPQDMKQNARDIPAKQKRNLNPELPEAPQEMQQQTRQKKNLKTDLPEMAQEMHQQTLSEPQEINEMASETFQTEQNMKKFGNTLRKVDNDVVKTIETQQLTPETEYEIQEFETNDELAKRMNQTKKTFKVIDQEMEQRMGDAEPATKLEKTEHGFRVTKRGTDNTEVETGKRNKPKAYLKDGKKLSKKSGLPPLKVKKCCQPVPTLKLPDIKYMHTNSIRTFRQGMSYCAPSNGIILARLLGLPKTSLHSHYMKLTGNLPSADHLTTNGSLLQKALNATHYLLKYLKK